MSSLGIMTDMAPSESMSSRVSDAVPILPSIQQATQAYNSSPLRGPLIQSSAHLNPSFEDLGVPLRPDYSYIKRKGSMPQVVRSPFPSESEHLFAARLSPIPPRFKSIAPPPSSAVKAF